MPSSRARSLLPAPASSHGLPPKGGQRAVVKQRYLESSWPCREVSYHSAGQTPGWEARSGDPQVPSPGPTMSEAWRTLSSHPREATSRPHALPLFGLLPSTTKALARHDPPQHQPDSHPGGQARTCPKDEPSKDKLSRVSCLSSEAQAYQWHTQNATTTPLTLQSPE